MHACKMYAYEVYTYEVYTRDFDFRKFDLSLYLAVLLGISLCCGMRWVCYGTPEWFRRRVANKLHKDSQYEL